jgi:hypothetical protein
MSVKPASRRDRLMQIEVPATAALDDDHAHCHPEQSLP